MPKSRKGKKGNGDTGKLVVAQLLPTIAPFPVFSGHLRFSCSSGSSKNISQQNLIGLYGMGTASSTSVLPLIGAIRIRRIRMIDTQGNPIYLQWFGTQATGATFQAELEFNSIGNSIYPSVIDRKPPSNSAAAFWMGAQTSSTVFQLTGAVGDTYVDLWFDWVPAQQTTAQTLTNVPSTSGLYTLPLDGPGASPTFPSVSPNRIS